MQHCSYQPLLLNFVIASLSERKKISGMKFLFKLVNGFINSPEILGSLNFNVSRCRIRSTAMFYVFTYSTNYAVASMNKIISIANKIKFICVALIPLKNLMII